MTGNRVTPAESVLALARRFFEGMNDVSELREPLAGAEHAAQFVTLANETFFVIVRGGKVEFGAGARLSKDTVEGLYIVEVQDCLPALLDGDITLGEAIFHQKLRIPGYRNKEPMIARFSKFLRLGVWALVPAAQILMPAR